MQLELSQLRLKYAALRIADDGQRSRLAAHLGQHGQQQPVVVTRSDRAGEFVLIDGYRRVGALRDLGRDHVEALVLELDEAAALVLSHRLEHGHRRTALEEGWLVRELCEAHRIELRRLGVLLGRSASWVSRRLSLVRALPDDVQEAVRDGRVRAHAAMKYLVPLARANSADCARLVERLGHERPTVRQMQRLYDAWRSSDREQRKRIVENPVAFLKAAEEQRSAADESVERRAELVRRDCEMISSIATRARRRIDEGLLRALDGRCRSRLFTSVTDARQRVISLGTRVEEEIDDAGSRRAGGDPCAVAQGLRTESDRASAPDLA
jgi:ParB family chromosome partitioning protein